MSGGERSSNPGWLGAAARVLPHPKTPGETRKPFTRARLRVRQAELCGVVRPSSFLSPLPSRSDRVFPPSLLSGVLHGP